MYLRISQANMQVFPTFPEAEWANIKPIRSRSHARWARSITTLVPIWHLGTWLQCGRGLAVGWKGVASWVVLWDALWLKEKGHQGAPLICAIWEGDFFFAGVQSILRNFQIIYIREVVIRLMEKTVHHLGCPKTS